MLRVFLDGDVKVTFARMTLIAQPVNNPLVRLKSMYSITFDSFIIIITFNEQIVLSIVMNHVD